MTTEQIATPPIPICMPKPPAARLGLPIPACCAEVPVVSPTCGLAYAIPRNITSAQAQTQLLFALQKAIGMNRYLGVPLVSKK